MKRKIFMSLIAVVAILTSCSNDDLATELAGITMSKTSVTLKPETSETLTLTFYPDNADDKRVTWVSSDPSVATVNDKGLVEAVAPGNTVITARSVAFYSLKASCDVTVSRESLNNVSGEVEGVWARNTTVNISGHITVAKGKTLVIEEGCNVIFDDNGVGASHTGIEFMVYGNLYCKGTSDNPILFSVAPGKRTKENIFAGLWGGIIATADCEEMLFENVIIEYTGADCVADSPSVLAGIYTAGGDQTPHITTNNVNGKYVITNSTLRYGRSDAVYLMGGQVIITNNIFAGNGETGGEAINVKAGCKVDAAYNVMFSPNTNGFKISSSGESPERQQVLVRAYNNTIVNSGWRRDGVKGGGVYLEKNALASIFNNLHVNCKFMAMTPSWDSPSTSGGADQNSIVDYNFYCSGSQESPFTQDNPTTLTAYAGYTSSNKNYWHEGKNGTTIVDEHSVVAASAGDVNTDPKFVSFGLNTVALDTYEYDNSWDFSVQSGSPVLTGARSDFSGAWNGYFTSTGFSVNGSDYKTPAPSAVFGAGNAK